MTGDSPGIPAPCGRNFLYIFSFTAVSLSSGLVYGYPHLRNNLFSNGSTLSESELAIVYTCGAWTVQGGRFFTGVARDKFGTKYIAFLSIFCAAVGCIGLAFSDPNNVMALSISFFFVGLGSGGQLCLQPVASLFPKRWQGTIMASFSGAFQVSGLVFLVLIQMTHDRAKSYFSYSIVLFGLAICALLFLPRYQFLDKDGVQDDDNDNDNNNNDNKNSSNVEVIETKLEHYDMVSATPHEKEFNDADEISMSKDNHDSVSSLMIVNIEDDNREIQETEEESNKDEKITALRLIKSPEYVLLIIWFSILLIPLQYYIGTIGFQLERKGDSDGTYLNLFSILYALSAILSPAMGKIADTCGLGASQFLATILTAVSLLTLTSSTMSLNFHLVGIICYGIGRMAVFGMFFTNIGKRFGYTHYGTLAGSGLLISAIFSLLQYPLIDIAARGSEYQVNLICGCTILVLGAPYCLWLGLKESNENKRNHSDDQGTGSAQDNEV